MASDTIIRALHFVSKRNLKSARRLIEETRLIVRSVADGLVDQLEAGSRAGEYMSAKRERREALSVDSLFVMKAIMVDIDYILEGLEDESAPLFDRDQRNLGAQQVCLSSVLDGKRLETDGNFFFLLGHDLTLTESVDVPNGNGTAVLQRGKCAGTRSTERKWLKRRTFFFCLFVFSSCFVFTVAFLPFFFFFNNGVFGSLF